MLRPGHPRQPMQIMSDLSDASVESHLSESRSHSGSPSSTLTATERSRRPLSTPARSLSPAPTASKEALDGRRTLTTMISSAMLSVSRVARTTAITQRSEEDTLASNWAEVNVPALTSSDDLTSFESEQDDDDLYMEDPGRLKSLPRRMMPSPLNSFNTANRSGPISHSRSNSGRLRGTRLSHLRRSVSTAVTRDGSSSTGIRGGIQSEPEGHDTASADESFLELLEVARTFISMRPQYGSSTVSAASRSDAVIASPSAQHPSSSSRQSSPVPPASLSASTNFTLSASDSPPSRGLASSREMDPEDQVADDDNDGSPLPVARRRTDSQRPSDKNVTRTGYQEEESDTREPDRSGGSSETWWEWLAAQLRRISVGVGLIGMGLVVAIGVGVIKKPAIRRQYVLS